MRKFTFIFLGLLPFSTFAQKLHSRVEIPDSAYVKIDTTLKAKGYSKDLLIFLIATEIIDPNMQEAFKNHETPDWTLLEQAVESHYGHGVSLESTMDGEIRWYGFKKEWPLYCRQIVRRVNEFGPFALVSDRAIQFNTCAWEIFLHSRDNSELRTALRWSDSAVTMNPLPEHLDTYANLLYKLGRVQQAIAYEERALRTVAGKNEDMEKGIITTLGKMHDRKPTWP